MVLEKRPWGSAARASTGERTVCRPEPRRSEGGPGGGPVAGTTGIRIDGVTGSLFRSSHKAS